MDSGTDQQQYQMQLTGHLPKTYGDWFGSLDLAYKPDGSTVISANFEDQAALFWLLLPIRDLGLP